MLAQSWFFSKRKNIIPDQQQFTTRLLLFGSELLNNCNNGFIFQYVHEYLEKTGDLRMCLKSLLINLFI